MAVQDHADRRWAENGGANSVTRRLMLVECQNA